MKTTLLRTGLVVLSLAFSRVFVAGGESKVVFDNQSGAPAVVKLVGNWGAIPVSVAPGKTETLSAWAGSYYTIARFGTPGAYSYRLGKRFDLPESATMTMTLLKQEVEEVQGKGGGRQITDAEFEDRNANLANAYFISFGDIKNPEVKSTDWQVMPAVTEKILRTAASLQPYRTNAQVVFRAVRSPCALTNLFGFTLAPITALVERETFVTLGSYGFQAGGLPGVKAYVEIAAGRTNAVCIASNLMVWDGALYTDGASVLILRDGTSYRLDNRDAVAGSRSPSATGWKWKFWK